MPPVSVTRAALRDEYRRSLKLVKPAPLTAYLPLAAMAAVLLVVAAGLVDVHHIRAIARTSRPEAVVLILSRVLYLNRTAHPRFITLVPDPERGRKGFVNILNKPSPECPQLKIVRIDGSVFFGAVNHVAEQLDSIARENPEQADVAGCTWPAGRSTSARSRGRCSRCASWC